jgi:ADP-L-glycero-D-manno-heptose 6-epimerase
VTQRESQSGDRSRYIVTGGAGFIGSNLVAALLERDPVADVLVVDDCRSGSFANLIEAVERVGVGPFRGEFLASSTGELDWQWLLEEASPRAVFHLAAVTDTTVADERSMLEDNVEGFRELLEMCVASGTPLVYASSAATYGSPPQGASREAFPEEAAGAPNNVYGFSKWQMENLHRRIAAQRAASGEGPPHVVGLRYFNVFGPGEARKGKMASMAHQLTHQILESGRPRLFEHGEQARDQVAVEDVVACTIRGSEAGATPGVYNCGSGRATTFNEVADAVRAGLGVSESDAPTEYFEMPSSIRTFYQDFTRADMSAARAGLGHEVAHEPREAIARYAALLAGAGAGEPASV